MNGSLLETSIAPSAQGAASLVLESPSVLNLPIPWFKPKEAGKEKPEGPTEKAKSIAERLEASIVEVKRLEESLP